MKPVIGVTLDSEYGGGYSDYPWYALRQNYMSSLAAYGAVPLALPHLTDHVAAYLNLCHGIVVTGGAFDVPPNMFNEEIRSDAIRLKPARTEFEAALIAGALERDIPLLGICGGEQLLAVITGGTLVQHIPDEIKDALQHSSTVDTENGGGRVRANHDIIVCEGTLLAQLVGTATTRANSSHHQSVKSVGTNCRINAVAPDGVIEGIEYVPARFCLGVQWHPEYLDNEFDRMILRAFVKAAAS
ncbi:gamma-glutamyl-gamma-aminobutyrate hydrolase family protein [Candidatus Phyllobacterium onerii]|uniref:gamma-glutamyl-gamma-aminobutyrate hydrolase family protein n=1 Tax=Candidatus Phyllobacterium onerii TaxID=3020828 RepID=UPI00232E672D|nr:gamma-glutamyl-gamma-aminobutyrate hydrolase family protein [Phyllobacterium sp. IY22]